MSDTEGIITNNDHSKEFYSEVAATTTLRSQDILESQIIPSGETWEITHISASLPSNSISYIVLYFGSDIIFTAYGDRETKLNKLLTGDGIKAISFDFKNSFSVATPMGIKYIARKIDT